MSKLEKLIAKLLGDSSDYKFLDVKKVLLEFGFIEDHSTGSHHIFRHDDGRGQVIPKKHGNRVKKIYVKRVVKTLKLVEWYEKRKEDS